MDKLVIIRVAFNKLLRKTKFQQELSRVISYLQALKGVRRWLRYTCYQVEQNRKLQRGTIRSELKKLRIALSFLRNYAQQRISRRQSYKVFRLLFSRPLGVAPRPGILRRIFIAWSVEFIQIKRRERCQRMMVIRIKIKGQLKYYLESWETRWAENMADRCSILQRFRQLRNVTSAKCLKWFKKREIMLKLNNLDAVDTKSTTVQWNSFYEGSDRQRGSNSIMILKKQMEGKRSLSAFIASLLNNKAKRGETKFYRTCRLRKLFKDWHLMTVYYRNLTWNIREAKLLAINRYNAMSAIGELIDLQRVRRTLANFVFLWNNIISNRKLFFMKFKLSFIMKPLFVHWINVLKEAPVRRLQQEAVEKYSNIDGRSSDTFFSTNVSNNSEKIMDKKQRQQELQLLKSKRKIYTKEADEVSDDYSNRKDSCISNCIINYSGSNNTLSSASNLKQRSGHSTNTMNSSNRTRTGIYRAQINRPSLSNPITHNAFSALNTTVTVPLLSSSISSLWGSKVIDDCSRNSYSGQHRIKKLHKSEIY